VPGGGRTVSAHSNERAVVRRDDAALDLRPDVEVHEQDRRIADQLETRFSEAASLLEEAAIAPDIDTGLVNLHTRHRATSKGFQPCHRNVRGGCGESANGLHTRLIGCDSRRRSSLCALKRSWHWLRRTKYAVAGRVAATVVGGTAESRRFPFIGSTTTPCMAA
jgi:hypothetical protein